MNQLDLERLRRLKKYLDRSNQVCDPINFAMRQHELIHAIAEYLTYPLLEQGKDDEPD